VGLCAWRSERPLPSRREGEFPASAPQTPLLLLQQGSKPPLRKGCTKGRNGVACRRTAMRSRGRTLRQTWRSPEAGVAAATSAARRPTVYASGGDTRAWRLGRAPSHLRASPAPPQMLLFSWGGRNNEDS